MSSVGIKERDKFDFPFFNFWGATDWGVKSATAAAAMAISERSAKLFFYR